MHMYIHMHIHIRMHIHKHKHKHKHTRTNVMDAYIHTIHTIHKIHAHIHACMHIYIQYMHTYMHAYIHTIHAHIHAHINAYICSHKHLAMTMTRFCSCHRSGVWTRPPSTASNSKSWAKERQSWRRNCGSGSFKLASVPGEPRVVRERRRSSLSSR